VIARRHTRAEAEAGSRDRFLDPLVLSRISDLELLARTVVEGFISGLHRSPFLGFSVDFAEHRPYMPGDDIRRIDWRVYARTDRFYIKEYEAETNTNVLIVLDVSRSMDFSSGGVSKLDYGRFLAASLAYLSGQQRDRVGFVAFDGDTREYVPPAIRHRDIVLHTIDRLEPGEGGGLTRPLSRVGERLTKKGIVALISDLYAEPAEVARAVGALRRKGNDLLVFHLLDPAEIGFPYHAPSDFVELETGRSMPVTPDRLRDDYVRLMRDHLDEIQALLVGQGVDYAMFDTSRPLDGALFHYLSRRESRLRVR
jgi:uncharacterized protein (DUF58 family)